MLNINDVCEIVENVFKKLFISKNTCLETFCSWYSIINDHIISYHITVINSYFAFDLVLIAISKIGCSCQHMYLSRSSLFIFCLITDFVVPKVMFCLHWILQIYSNAFYHCGTNSSSFSWPPEQFLISSTINRFAEIQQSYNSDIASKVSAECLIVQTIAAINLKRFEVFQS